MAFGTIAPSIYVPRRVLTDLGAAEQETLIAHEVAHIARHDPAWRLVGLVIERVFFFQPLNRVANREMATAAELLCDEWAAASTKRPLALAQCLAEVAGWVAGCDRLSPAPTMAGRPSELARRIERLVDDSPRLGRRRSWLPVALGGAVLGLAAVLAPGVSSGAAQPPLAQVGMGSTLAYVCDRDDGYARIHVSDGGDVVVISGGDVDTPEVVVAPPSKKLTKKEARKKRKKAKKRLRKAFRDARKRGDAMPTDAEIAAALGRHKKRAKAGKAKPLKLKSGDTTVLIYETPEGGVKVVGKYSPKGHEHNVDLSAYAEAYRKQAMKHARRAQAQAMRDHEEAMKRHRKAMKRADEARRRAIEAQERMLRRQQRELEERKRELERELRRRRSSRRQQATPPRPPSPPKKTAKRSGERAC